MSVLARKQTRGRRRCDRGSATWVCLALSAAAGVLLAASAPAIATSTNLVFRYDTRTTGDSVTFSFSEGQRAASAKFDSFSSGGANYMEVTLANISSEDVPAPEWILTAVFFDLEGSPTLTPQSAVLSDGSIVLFDGQPAGGDVGGEWAYWLRDGEMPPPDPNQGIGSSGLDLFAPSERFPGDNLDGPDGVDGLQYGLTSLGDDPTIGNAAVTGQFPLIQHSVVFTLSGLPDGFDATTKVSNVHFWYGTDRSPVPEPLTLVGVFMGIAGLSGYVRRRWMMV